MSCQKYQKDLSELLDGQLTGMEKRRLEEHLKSCQECAQMLHQLTVVTERVKDLRAYMVDEKRLAAKIKAHIASRALARTEERPLGVWRRVPVFALLVLIAIGMGNFAGRSIVEVLLPTGQEFVTEASLIENGASLGDVFIDLTGTGSGDR